MLLYSLGKYPIVWLLDHRVVLFSIFWGISYCFSQWWCQLVFPIVVHEGSSFSTSSPTSVIAWVVNVSHSDRCEVVFDLYFPDEWCWAFFHVLVGHLYVFFGELSIHVFCPFFSLDYLFFGCGVWWVLYRFWILALCLICHLQISFPIPLVAF